MTTITANQALSIPVTRFPQVIFYDQIHSWRDDAWEVLREMARTGCPAVELCGSELRFSYRGDDGQNIAANVVPGFYFVAPASSPRNRHAAGYDGNRFDTRAEAEAAIDALNATPGMENDWIVSQDLG